MAVYTPVGPDALAALLDRYDLGPALSCKGIAEGVENSNFLVVTASGPVILTLYERRLRADDLPYFIDLLGHLHRAGLPVPRMLPDRAGRVVQSVAGRPACLIEYLPGLSLAQPDPAGCRLVGGSLAQLHRATRIYAVRRANPLGAGAWAAMAAACGPLDAIAPGLADDVDAALADVARDWPRDWPVQPVHTDLFPDNVLISDGAIGGLIDFYFTADDLAAYDYMVTHAAWCWSADGIGLDDERSAALWSGYRDGGGDFSPAERAALPLLGRGAALRFVLTRAAAWADTPDHALVVRKHPDPYRQRMLGYATLSPDQVLGA